MPLRRLIVTLLACLPLLAPAPLLAQRRPRPPQDSGELPPEHTINRLATRYFRMMGTIDPNELREYGVYMDILGEEYFRMMRGLGGQTNEKFIVAIWQSRDEYNRFVGPAAANSGGIFMSHRKMLSTFTGGQSKDRVLSVLRHEGFHQFFHHYVGPGRPIWVNEGLAVYFEHSTLVDGKMLMGDVPGRYLLALRAAKMGGVLPTLEDMMTMPHQQWNENLASGSPMGSLQYPVAWSIVHFLQHGAGDQGRAMLAAYLRAISRNMPFEAAVAAAFGRGRSLQIFQQRWVEYIDTMQPAPVFQSRNNLQTLVQSLRPLVAQGVDFAQFESADQLRDYMKTATRIDEELFVCPGGRIANRPVGYEYSTVEIGGRHYPVLTNLNFRGLRVAIVWEEGDRQVTPSVEIVGR